MDLYKKLKQKITEEFDTETDDDGASSHVTGECQTPMLSGFIRKRQANYSPQAFIVDAFLVATRDHFKVLHRYKFLA